VDVLPDRNGSGALQGPWACPANHISPKFQHAAVLSAPESARAIELQPLEKDPRRRPKPPIRGEVTGFSKSSRRRLLWLIGNLSEPILNSALFLTLTYPSGEPNSVDRTKHLDTLLKRMRREAPEASAIWKLEYTKKETPHFHLLILNLNFWHHAKIASAWAAIVKSENPHHEKAGTQVQRVTSQKHVARYIVKYVAKSQPYPESHRGRVWGKAGPIHLALSRKELYAVSRCVYNQIRRTFDAIRKSHQRTKAFKRAQNTFNRQRWFLQGSEVIRYLTWLQVEPLNLSPT